MKMRCDGFGFESKCELMIALPSFQEGTVRWLAWPLELKAEKPGTSLFWTDVQFYIELVNPRSWLVPPSWRTHSFYEFFLQRNRFGSALAKNESVPVQISCHMRTLTPNLMITLFSYWNFLPNICVVLSSVCCTSFVAEFFCGLWYDTIIQPWKVSPTSIYSSQMSIENSEDQSMH